MAGTRDLILDLSQVGFMSSSGIVTLHSLALIMRGDQPPDLEQGWSALHEAADFVESSQEFERHFKLVNPTARVRKTLVTTGFDGIFQVFENIPDAIASVN